MGAHCYKSSTRPLPEVVTVRRQLLLSSFSNLSSKVFACRSDAASTAQYNRRPCTLEGTQRAFQTLTPSSRPELCGQAKWAVAEDVNALNQSAYLGR